MVPADRLDTEVARVASQLAAYGPAVVRQQKRLLRQWQQEPLETSIRDGVGEFAAAFLTGETQHFMKEFTDRKAGRAG